MTLRVVGAGIGRTGTHSLKIALEQLLGAPCYHMLEVLGRPQDVPLWTQAFEGNPPNWDYIFSSYVAGVDWPVGGCWREVSESYPDSVILLSSRDSEAWWKSFESTILQVMVNPPEGGMQPPPGWVEMATLMLNNAFGPNWQDKDAMIAGYERHNADVRATAPADRLVDWQPGDGWAPICQALGLPVPNEPFPHVNTTAEFRAMTGIEAAF